MPRRRAVRPTGSIGKIPGPGILKLLQHSGARFRPSGRPTSAARYPVLMLFRGFSRREGAENAISINLLRRLSRPPLFARAEKRRPGEIPFRRRGAASRKPRPRPRRTPPAPPSERRAREMGGPAHSPWARIGPRGERAWSKRFNARRAGFGTGLDCAAPPAPETGAAAGGMALGPARAGTPAAMEAGGSGAGGTRPRRAFDAPGRTMPAMPPGASRARIRRAKRTRRPALRENGRVL